MNPTEQLREHLAVAEREFQNCREQIVKIRKLLSAQEVQDYTFAGPGGAEVKLSELFGDSDELLLIHNMGKSCAYCTLWADGFNGALAHLENRAAFAVVSPDDPETQQAFAQSRGWQFRMVSDQGNSFSTDMGYENEKGSPLPGVTTFKKAADGKIMRVATAPFGPRDDYCSTWHLFDLLDGGSEGWAPKFEY